MTVEKKVKVTPADSYPLGHAKENKDASAYTGFKYPTGGGNDIGVYKQPMPNTYDADINYKTNPNTMSGVETRNTQPARDVSIGDRGNKDINPYGVGEMRGYGAATKGRKISGKMG
jgi:hypothetical protein